MGLGFGVLALIMWVMFAPRLVKQKENNQVIPPTMAPVPAAGPIGTNPFGLLPIDQAAGSLYGPISSAGRARRSYRGRPVGVSAYRNRILIG